jgi:hypothetical protein
MARRVFASGVLWAALGVCSSAHAQSPADIATARELFKEGAKFAQDGQWNEARQRYEKSLALKRSPLTLYSLGIAYRNLRRFVEALESHRAFLAEMHKDDDRDKPYEQPAREAIVELEKLVARLDIQVLPKDNERKMMLTIDGIIIPEAAYGYPRLVDPGRHTVAVQAKGFRTATQAVTVGEGEKLPVSLRLEATEAHGSTSADGRNARALPILPTALLAGGGVVFAVGLTVGFFGVQKASTAPTRNGPEAKDARRLALAGDIVSTAGIITAGAGLTLLFMKKYGSPAKPDAKPATTWIAPVITPNALGLVGQF